ncbi:MAG TPA: radical SAM protein [Phycisphaerae bacterium]|nr:radical SAM protein [Phycisphaerae bacterium]
MRFLLATSTQKQLVKVWVCQETSPAGSLLPPVDLASVAAMIRQKGHQARIADLRLAREPLHAYAHELDRLRPDAVIINLSTTGAQQDYALLAATPPGVKRICFGTHAQALPAEVFRRGFDFILLGDPEAALSSLIDHRLNGDAADGVLTPAGTDKQPRLAADLDALPRPALDLLDLDEYRSSIIRRGKRFTLLLGSRGCPHNCTYCLYPVLFGRKTRLRSAKSIVDEMEEDHREHGIGAFYFLDATFNIKNGRVEEIAEEIIARRLRVDWSCNMRVTPVSRATLALMKKAGCDWIFYGVEDQDCLAETRKNISRQATIEAFHLTKQAGISTVAFLMIFPRPDLDEKTYAARMLAVLRTLKADAFQCNIAIPFPGTEMWREQSAAGRLDMCWSCYDPHGDILPYDCAPDLIAVKRRIYRGFLLSHPMRTLKVARRMGLSALAATAGTFIRGNLLPSPRRSSRGPIRSTPT